MPEITKHNHGAFCWAELGTTDQEAAKQFYTKLFGWTAFDSPIGEGAFYTMLKQDGKDVGALYSLQEAQRAQGVPAHWGYYIASDNVDETAAAIKAAGGTVLMEPFDVMDLGRMTVAQDPSGGMFSVWQAAKNIGVQLFNEPGALCWFELATRDTAAAEAFYTKVFGWEAQTAPMGPTMYTMFRKGAQEIGGMVQMTAEWGELPPHWMGYWSVADCEATVAAAQALGSQQLMPPTDVPGVGRFALLQDPQGATFSVFKLNQ